MSIRNRISLLGVRITIAATVLFAAAGVTGASAQDRQFTPVTDTMLANPDVADWLHCWRTLDAWGYSPLDQINTDNVHRLQLVWAWRMEPGASQPMPLVYDSVMYIANPNNIIQAIDAATGEVLWQYRRVLEGPPDETLSSRSRSIAIYCDKIYLNTSDAYIVALDARTGEVAWDHTVANRAQGYRYTSGPIVVNGNIVAGMSSCERFKEDVCFISAHDAETGEQVWRTSTIARPGDPGGDTWGDLPLEYRAGADTDRHLYFYDAATGDVLFQTRLPASVQGFPITYAVDGRQYVAVPVGGNRSNAIYVFALPVEAGGR